MALPEASTKVRHVRRGPPHRWRVSSVRTLSLLVASLACLLCFAFVRNDRAGAAESCDASALKGSVRQPTTGGPFAYRRKERTFATSQVVVHWVSSGRAAPPLRDVNRNGIPDYVEQLSYATSRAIRFYSDPAFVSPAPFVRDFPVFQAPACDNAGPDQRPDVYIVNLNTRGRAISREQGQGGAFVLISNSLEHPKKTVWARYGLLWWTAAHEAFQLV